MLFRKSNARRRAAQPTRRAAAALIEGVESRTMLSATVPTKVSPDLVYLNRTEAAADATYTEANDGYSPAEVSTAYGFSGASFSSGTIAADGAGQTIALVDAYNDPNIRADLATFDAQFGLDAPASFKVVSQTGTDNLPATSADWAGEISLDVEWAHAIAPAANILLVETTTDDTDNLIAGVNYARTVAGVSVVSMSWGGSEFESYGGSESSTQTAYDADFTTPAGHKGVTFVSAAGDSGEQDGVDWPASSPNVLSVGGTTLDLDVADGGTYESEAGWAGTSSGYSQVESEPAYQDAVNQSGAREVSDVSYGADPDNGFAVYDSLADTSDGVTTSGWQEVGGTSAGAPQWAALVAIADQGRAVAGLSTLDGATQTLPDLYGLYSAPGTTGYSTYTSYFNDVTSGGSGDTGGFGPGGGHRGHSGNAAAEGYDAVTGLGTPKATALIDDLATSAAVSGTGSTTTTGGGTASGGSTTATETLSPVAIAVLSTPPDSVIGGVAGTVKVRLTNTALTTFSGPLTLNLYVSTDTTVGNEVATLKPTTIAKLTLRAGGTRTVTVKFDYPNEGLATGSYYLVAAADATGTDTQATSAATSAVTINAPTADLAVTFAGADASAVTVTPGDNGKATVEIANVGNVSAVGTVVLTLEATSGQTVVQLYQLPKKVKIAAGKSVKLTVPFTAPTNDAGTYDLTASVTSVLTVTDADSANDTATVPTRSA